MGKRRVTLEIRKEISNEEVVKITKEKDECFFEIGKEITSDIAEAVSILMRKVEWDDKIWEMEINKNIILEDITPEKSLFWLSGGYNEWRSLNNYKKPWMECYLEFQEEFGFLIVNIVKKSKTLRDIRNGFVKYLNLPTLYDFAISKGLAN
jgi:hypothetical protein